MSLLRANQLANVAGTGSPDIVAGELSRVRFNLNGTGVIAARDTFNVSSFTDRGLGQYTATFATAFPAANWSAFLTARAVNTYFAILQGLTISATEIGFDSLNTTNNAADADQYQAAIFGDRP